MGKKKKKLEESQRLVYYNYDPFLWIASNWLYQLFDSWKINIISGLNINWTLTRIKLNKENGNWSYDPTNGKAITFRGFWMTLWPNHHALFAYYSFFKANWHPQSIRRGYICHLALKTE